MATIKIDKDGNIPDVEVLVGHAHLGDYVVALFDKDKRFSSMVGDGSTGDPIEDRFKLVATRKEMAKLDGFTLAWSVLVKALVVGPGEQYNVTVTVTQGDTTLAQFDTGAKPFTKKTVLEEGDWLLSLS